MHANHHPYNRSQAINQKEGPVFWRQGRLEGL
jgi:hypothetical protein